MVMAAQFYKFTKKKILIYILKMVHSTVVVAVQSSSHV